MKIKIQTMLGDIVVRLYDETPIHRDNFVKSKMASSISVEPWQQHVKVTR